MNVEFISNRNHKHRPVSSTICGPRAAVPFKSYLTLGWNKEAMFSYYITVIITISLSVVPFELVTTIKPKWNSEPMFYISNRFEIDKCKEYLRLAISVT